MRTQALVLGLILLPVLPGAAAVVYDRPINIITSNYDLVDTTYMIGAVWTASKSGISSKSISATASWPLKWW